MASNTVKMSYVHKPPLSPLEHRTLPQLFDVHANEHPERDAFVFYNTNGQRSSYSFRQIQEMSLALAASFLRLGWKRGQKVAHMVPKQVEFVVSYIALLRIGVNAIVLPEHGRPADEVVAHIKRLDCHGYIMHEDSAKSFDIQGILTDIGPVVLIGSDINKSTYPDCRSYSDLLSEGKELDVDEVLQRQQEVQFDDPVTAVFTSGSTGRPKPVQHTHHSLTNRSLAVSSSHDPPQRSFNDRPFCWIGGLASLLTVMVKGITTVAVPSVTSVKEGDTDFVLSVLQNEKCTDMKLMPYLMKDILHHPKIEDYDLSNLKFFSTGGQAVSVSDLRKLKAVFPHCTVIVSYGSSETCLIATSVVVMPVLPDRTIEDEVTLPLKIVPGIEVKIIDETNKLVPLGKVGEITVRSPTTFLEYLDDPDQTSQVISPTGWVHTGDLGYMDDGSRIRICGRKTDVIKRATAKVYPAEVEQMLIKHPHVQNVLVVGIPDARLYEELCACVIPKSGSSLNGNVYDEWDYLKCSVDEQGLSMKPKYAIVMEKFPVTKTGKFNRKALREMALKKLGIRADELIADKMLSTA